MTRPAKSSLVLDGRAIKARLEAERLETSSMVHVDWVRFTVRLRHAVTLRLVHVPASTSNAYVDIAQQGDYRIQELRHMIGQLPEVVQDAAGQAATLADRVAGMLGEGFARASMMGKGHDFYKHRWPILRNDVECGWVGFGASSDSPRQAAQASTIHVNLFGAACTFAADGWREKIAALVDELEADITRCDLAVDFFDGFKGGIERVVDQYKQGLCDSMGRKLKVKDINFVRGSERSLYIGSKEAGKETNIYEKGDMLFGEEAGSDWLRFELRYGNKLRVISSDILRRPADFFAGASEWHASVLAEAGEVAEPERVKCRGRLPLLNVEAEAFQNLKWAFNTAGATIATVWRLLSDEDLFRLVDSSKVPRRLQRFTPSELKIAFAAAMSRSVVSEPCPALA
ncbi:replication initiation factor domain-containing protein [Aquabacterium sp. CECT 9606]|uniref:replication initiation factor domain-containing protein n=1 Tax=Aquabacterium sp. CECT 9606 TaxID=2845822 RepID=UPI001E55C36F|nr:replication initiation factor domain-containing protein [Aquabacterium sp. CECT 9606]CAH0352809.1 hypothetical protein AQB9606_02825 [Aquabacterium sp. CECT 9606]